MKQIDVTQKQSDEAANVAKYGIFLVVQNTDHLYGKYFLKATVIADTVEQAISKVENHILKYYRGDSGQGVIFERELLQVFEIGRLTKRPEGVGQRQDHLKDEDILVMLVVEDHVMPGTCTGMR